METRTARIEFENIDTGERIFIKRFRFYEFEDNFRIWNRAYRQAQDFCGIHRMSKNIRMISFHEI